MALAYLLDPCLQHQNRAGVNNVSGYFEVFEYDTDDRATVYTDFSGTLAPSHIGIDNNGRAVMIVDSSIAYRVEMHAPNGDLIYTQAPVWTMASGGGVGGLVKIVSTDGTISVDKTTVGAVTTYDLSATGDEEPATWGSKVCNSSAVLGNNEWVAVAYASSEGSIRYNNGWTVTKKCAIDIAASIEMTTGDPAGLHNVDVKCEFFKNGTSVLVENGQVDPSKSVDRVSFEYKGAANKTDVVDAIISVRSAQALTVGLVGRVFYNEECDGVIGGSGGGGGDYVAGEGINITGDVISVDQSVIQHKLTTGPNIDIINNVISTEKTVVAAGQNVSVTSSLDNVTRTRTYTVSASGAAAQVQSNWAQTDTSSVDYIQNKPQNLVQDADYVHTDNNFTDADKSKLDGIESGAEVNVQANWNETNTSSDAYIQNKPDLSQYATTTDLSGKADKVDGATDGNLAGLDATGNLTDSGIAASDVATQSDLSGKQDTLVAGDNITINSTTNVISATDTNTHRPIQLEGSQILGDNTDPLNFVAGSNVTITNSNGTLTFSSSGGSGTQVQSDWTENDPADPAYIKHRPDLSQYATVTDLSGKADRVDNATAGNLAGLDANGNLTDSGIAATDVATTSDLAGKQDTLTPGANIQIVNNVISATDTDTHRVIQLEGSPILGSASTDPLNFVAGSNVNITNSNGSLTISASGGSGTQVQSDWTEDDSSDPAYIRHRPIETPLVAGDNITISEVNNQVVISATGGTQVQSDWNQTNSSAPDYIRNKPDMSDYQGVLTAGNNITIDQNNVISATAAPQVQSDWEEDDSSDPAYIRNRPVEKELVAGSNITMVEIDNTQVAISANVPQIGTVVV